MIKQGEGDNTIRAPRDIPTFIGCVEYIPII